MSVSFRERLNDPVLTQLYDYWCSRRSEEKLPARADISPIDIPRPALPYVILADVDASSRRARYRLVGTKMVDEWGADFTGKYVDEIMKGSYLQFLRGLFSDVIDHRCAVLSESRFRWDVGRVTGTRRLFMPLAADGTTVDMVLIGQTFDHSNLPEDDPRKLLERSPDHEEVVRIHETP